MYSRWDLNCCCETGTCEEFYQVFDDIMPSTTTICEDVDCNIQTIPGSFYYGFIHEYFWWRGTLTYTKKYAERSTIINPFPVIPAECQASMQYNITNRYNASKVMHIYFPMHPLWESTFGCVTFNFDRTLEAGLYESNYDWDEDPLSFYGSPVMYFQGSGYSLFNARSDPSFPSSYYPGDVSYSIPEQNIYDDPNLYEANLTTTSINQAEKYLTFPEIILKTTGCIDIFQMRSLNLGGYIGDIQPPEYWERFVSGGPTVHEPYIYSVSTGYLQSGTQEEPLYTNDIYQSCKLTEPYFMKPFPYMGNSFIERFYETIETIKNFPSHLVFPTSNSCTFRIEARRNDS